MKRTIIARGKFIITEPMCTISTMENGDFGFIRESDVVVYKQNKNYFIAIKKNAEVFENPMIECGIEISKEDDTYEIESLEDIRWNINRDFIYDDTLYEAPVSINTIPVCETISTTLDRLEIGDQDRLNDFHQKEVEAKHIELINYGYEESMGETKFAKLMIQDIKTDALCLDGWTIGRLILFANTIKSSKQTLVDEIKDTKEKYPYINLQEDMPIYGIMGEYLEFIDKTVQDTIKRLKECKDESNFSDLKTDDLLEMLNDPTKDHKAIKTELKRRSGQ